MVSADDINFSLRISLSYNKFDFLINGYKKNLQHLFFLQQTCSTVISNSAR